MSELGEWQRAQRPLKPPPATACLAYVCLMISFILCFLLYWLFWLVIGDFHNAWCMTGLVYTLGIRFFSENFVSVSKCVCVCVCVCVRARARVFVCVCVCKTKLSRVCKCDVDKCLQTIILTKQTFIISVSHLLHIKNKPTQKHLPKIKERTYENCVLIFDLMSTYNKMYTYTSLVCTLVFSKTM